MYVEDTNAEARLAAARQRLTEAWADPWIRAIARNRADHPQDAEDALQATYLAMYRLPNLIKIDDMRAYFCRVLIRALYRQQRPASCAGRRRRSCISSMTRSVIRLTVSFETEAP